MSETQQQRAVAAIKDAKATGKYDAVLDVDDAMALVTDIETLQITVATMPIRDIQDLLTFTESFLHTGYADHMRTAANWVRMWLDKQRQT
jgi:microsomal dipeptidase-like Zn-dependent dipeptidase